MSENSLVAPERSEGGRGSQRWLHRGAGESISPLSLGNIAFESIRASNRVRFNIALRRFNGQNPVLNVGT